MKNFTKLMLPFLLSGCAAITTNSAFVELEDINPIVSGVYNSMINCLTYKNQTACNNTESLFQKYPWVIDGNVSVTNFGGMRENEAEIESSGVRKKVQYIRDNYTRVLGTSLANIEPDLLSNECFTDHGCDERQKCRAGRCFSNNECLSDDNCDKNQKCRDRKCYGLFE